MREAALNHLYYGSAPEMVRLTANSWDYTSPPARPKTIIELREEIDANVNLLELLAKERIIKSVKDASGIKQLPLPPRLREQLALEKNIADHYRPIRYIRDPDSRLL